MARVLKWQEKLVLAFAALLFSVTSGFGFGPRDSLARTCFFFEPPMQGGEARCL